ncbi:MAG: hypothetical protein Q8P13_02570 [bacterium]|nr:hypothetical protein [bacterium]
MLEFILTLHAKYDEAGLLMDGRISCPRQAEGCRGWDKIRYDIASYLRLGHEEKSLKVSDLRAKELNALFEDLNGTFRRSRWSFVFICPSCGVHFTFSTAVRRFVRQSAEGYLTKAVQRRGRPKSFSSMTVKTKPAAKKTAARKE